MKRMMRAFVFVLPLLAVAAVAYMVLPGQRSELKRLQAALRAAPTQTDLNLTSKALADYWSVELIKVEGKLRKTLAPEALSLFQKATDAWREYRSIQTDFEGDEYRGGSIQPLIRNKVFAALTERRVRDPEQLCKENCDH